MQGLTCLIAPCHLAVIAGELDRLFPIDGVETGYEAVKKVYAKAGVKENCRMVKTPKSHWWCEDMVWNTIHEEMEKLNW